MNARFLLIALCAVIATVCVLSAPASTKPAPAILALDLGSEWLKGCLANQKSSSIGTHLDVVINEQSARKTPNLLGFDGEDDRVLGDAAVSLLFRSPAKVFPHAKRLLGQLFNSPSVKSYKRDFPSLVLAEDPERHTVIFKRNGAEDLSVEEVVVQLLQLSRKQAFEHIKANAEKEDIEQVNGVVVTVPEYFTASQRKLYSQLITLAGYDAPKAILNDLSAVAIDYAVRNLLPSTGKTSIAFFASGTVGTSAALVQMEWAGEKIQLKVLKTASDPLIGGYSIDTILRDNLAKRFDAAQKAGTTSILTNPRSMAKLLREARELKEMLSVSPSIEVQLEELHAGKDFKTTVTQEELHEWTSELTQKMLVPLKQVLEGSENVSGIELFGGSVRSPAIQNAIKSLFPSIPLGKHVDGEESVVLGAAHYAGTLEGISKLTPVQVDETLVLPTKTDDTQAFDLSESQVSTLAGKIKSLDDKAEQRRARDAARNALESALNDARDLVASAPKGKKDVAAAAEDLIAQASAFVDDSDKTTTAEAFEEKRAGILAAIEPLRAPKKVEKVEKSTPTKPKKKRDRRAEHKKAMEEQARQEKVKKEKEAAAAKKKAAADKATKDKAQAKKDADKKKADAKKKKSKNGKDEL